MCFPNFQWMMGHRFTMSCQARAPTGWVAAVSDPILRGLARYVPYLRWSLASRVVTVVTVVGSAMAVLAWQVGWWRQKLNEAERSSFVLIPICFIILMVYTLKGCVWDNSASLHSAFLDHCWTIFSTLWNNPLLPRKTMSGTTFPCGTSDPWRLSHIYIYIIFSHMFTLKASVQLWPCSNGRTKERPEMTTGLSLAEKDVNRNGQAQWFSFCQVGGWNSAWIVITVYNCGQFLWQMMICTMMHQDLNHRHHIVSRSWSMGCLELRNSNTPIPSIECGRGKEWCLQRPTHVQYGTCTLFFCGMCFFLLHIYIYIYSAYVYTYIYIYIYIYSSSYRQ